MTFVRWFLNCQKTGMIDISEEFDVAASRDHVWAVLHDAQATAACIPGARLGESLGDNKYRGAIDVSFGPVRASFGGQVQVAYDEQDYSCSLEASGHDARGATRASGTALVRLTGDERCHVIVTANVKVAGPLATFARTGGAHLARVIFADFAENLARRLESSDTTSVESPSAVQAENSQEAARLSASSLVWRGLKSWFRATFRRRAL